MISAVQQGFSKKNGKPYAMVTLEDLEGTMSMLCINENYDRHRELLVPGKALLIVGEVNNDEDKPKLFPQEILLLDDAPRKYTKQVHFRLNTAHLTSETLETARALAESHPGRVPLFLCLRRPGGDLVFIETHEKYCVAPSQQLQQAVDDLFGEETYYAKVDTSLPERQKRGWERRPENGDE
jgi:DNA polymerase-3 subunit alpha